MIQLLATIVSIEHLDDALYWVVFFLGQCGWILACSAAAIRSQHNPLKTRWQYVKNNWDILSVRIFIFGFPLYMLLRHIPIGKLGEWTGQTWLTSFFGDGNLPGIVWLPIGFASDVAIAALGKWKRIPEPIRSFIAEKIPQVPQELVAVVETKTTVIPVNEGEQPSSTTTITSVSGPKE